MSTFADNPLWKVYRDSVFAAAGLMFLSYSIFIVMDFCNKEHRQTIFLVLKMI
jgi:hypothetical protein